MHINFLFLSQKLSIKYHRERSIGIPTLRVREVPKVNIAYKCLYPIYTLTKPW